MLASITPLHIRALVGDKVFARGQQYARQGYVTHLRLMGDALHAVVQGQSYTAYHVQVRLVGGLLASATCTCPYVAQYDALCKHIAATLLVALRGPLTTADALDAQLADLDAPALRTLVRRLLDTAPELLDQFDELLDALSEEDGAFLPLLAPRDDAAAVQIPRLLEAGQHDEALRLLATEPDEALALVVGEAVAETHPAWVLEQGARFVETNVGAGHTAQYDAAARWLIAMRRAHLAHDRPAAWREILGDVRTRFRRKHAFLQALETRLEEAHAAE